jgi:hypothetical protein
VVNVKERLNKWSLQGLERGLERALEAQSSPKERSLTEEECTCRLQETLGRVLDDAMHFSSVVDVASSFVVLVFVLC